MKLKRVLLASLVAGMGVAGGAQASLSVLQTWVGQYAVSTDGWGSTTQSGQIEAFVAAGSTVTAAYLYASTALNSAGAGGTLAGTTLTGGVQLGATGAGDELEAIRFDVTSIVKPIIDAGPGGTYNFRVTETSAFQDGYALVVVYSNPTLATSTVAILDGFSNPIGDSTQLNFAAPIDTTQPGFTAEMRLGIGFSFNGNPCGTSSTQVSRVDVNGTTITEKAGCNDDSADAEAENGNLITVGGSNDPFSPLLPTVAQDHERYDLVPFISNGATAINVTTRNPSNDDNIFLAVFRTSGVAGVNEPPPNGNVPEPASLALLGLGLAGLAMRRRVKA
jgi:hypothetical protein